MTIKKILQSFFNGVDNEQYSGETNRQIVVVYLFCSIGALTTAATGINAFISDELILALSLFTASIIYIFSFLIQKSTNNTKVSSAIIIYSLCILMIYLIYTDGVNNTGPLWIFVIAPVAFYLQGMKNGALVISLFLILMNILLFAPGNRYLATIYTFDFKLRLVLSFLTITFLSAIYEYSRQVTYHRLLNIKEKYKELASKDPLTHLPNRREVIKKLNYELSRIKRNDEKFSIAICDIDHFKNINDTYGHDAGDKVLVLLSSFFTQRLREQDTTSRWGGEEFLFILPQTSAEQASVFFESLRKKVSTKEYKYKDSTIKITVSTGIAEISPGNDLEVAISLADKRLYRAKLAGRNRVVHLG